MVTIWNDNIDTDNFKLFFESENEEKPESLFLTRFDDDRKTEIQKWIFEIKDKEFFKDDLCVHIHEEIEFQIDPPVLDFYEVEIQLSAIDNECSLKGQAYFTKIDENLVISLSSRLIDEVEGIFTITANYDEEKQQLILDALVAREIAENRTDPFFEIVSVSFTKIEQPVAPSQYVPYQATLTHEDYLSDTGFYHISQTLEVETRSEGSTTLMFLNVSGAPITYSSFQYTVFQDLSVNFTRDGVTKKVIFGGYARRVEYTSHLFCWIDRDFYENEFLSFIVKPTGFVKDSFASKALDLTMIPVEFTIQSDGPLKSDGIFDIYQDFEINIQNASLPGPLSLKTYAYAQNIPKDEPIRFVTQQYDTLLDIYDKVMISSAIVQRYDTTLVLTIWFDRDFYMKNFVSITAIDPVFDEKFIDPTAVTKTFSLMHANIILNLEANKVYDVIQPVRIYQKNSSDYFTINFHGTAFSDPGVPSYFLSYTHQVNYLNDLTIASYQQTQYTAFITLTMSRYFYENVFDHVEIHGTTANQISLNYPNSLISVPTIQEIDKIVGPNNNHLYLKTEINENCFSVFGCLEVDFDENNHSSTFSIPIQFSEIDRLVTLCNMNKIRLEDHHFYLNKREVLIETALLVSSDAIVFTFNQKIGQHPMINHIETNLHHFHFSIPCLAS